MGLFDKIFRPDKAKESEKALQNARGYFKTLTAYAPAFTSWGGAIYESELVRAAIDARARHIGKLRITIKGSANPTLQSKVKLGISPFQTDYQFLYRLSTILDVQNTAFIVPVHDERMTVIGYTPVLPSRAEIIDYKGDPWLRYHFSAGGTAAVELKKCGVMTKHQYKSDYFGETNEALRETMQLIHIQNQGIEEAVKSASTFRFMATLDNFAKPADLAAERERFVANNLSAESEANGLLLFPNTYRDIKQINFTPYTVDPAETKAIQTNIYNFFGVNEAVLQNAAFGDSWAAFYEGAVEPFAIQFSEVMTKVMFSDRERAQGTELLATSNRLQYLSNKDKLDVSAQMLDRGIFSQNDVREIWNLPPVEGGDVRIIRGEYYNADQKVSDDTEGGSNNANENE